MNDAFDAVQRLFQSMLAEEQNGEQSLVPGRGRNAFFDSQVSQEAVDIAFRQLPGMLVVVACGGMHSAPRLYWTPAVVPIG